MELICLDTHVLIWGIQEVSTPNRSQMIPKAKAFLTSLDLGDDQGLVPSVVVAELLLSVPPEVHTAFTTRLGGYFSTPPFDLKAATIFAQICQAKKESRIIEDLQQNLDATRTELRADCMIVATAIAQNAGYIISHDAKLKRFAEGYISVYEIPDVVEGPEFREESV